MRSSVFKRRIGNPHASADLQRNLAILETHEQLRAQYKDRGYKSPSIAAIEATAEKHHLSTHQISKVLASVRKGLRRMQRVLGDKSPDMTEVTHGVKPDHGG